MYSMVSYSAVSVFFVVKSVTWHCTLPCMPASKQKKIHGFWPGTTAVHGCYYPRDMAVRTREVMARPVTMLINPASKFQVSIVEIDPHGRYLITKLQIEYRIFYVINVYAPNDYREQEQFIRILGEKLVSKTDTTKLIISGDWNATLNKIDKWGGLPWKETTYRNSIIDLMEELDLLDIYRQFHADTKSFTYETKNSKLKSRIDFFLVSRPISYNVKRTEVRSSIAPDHKAIFLGMELQSELKRGPGTWKFNNTLLEDQDYIDLINFIYPRTLEKYKDVESKQLLWELIKMELRAKTMSYSKKKRAEVKKREIFLQHNLAMMPI